LISQTSLPTPVERDSVD